MVLSLLPYKKVDPKIHRFIYDSVDFEAPDLANRTNSNLFMDHCERHDSYSLLLNKNGKNALRNYRRFELGDCIHLAVVNAKHFKEAGIEVFWLLTDDGRMKLRFYVNIIKITLEPGELEKKLYNLSLLKVAGVINLILPTEPFPSDLFYIEDETNQVNTNAPIIGQFLNKVEKATNNWDPPKTNCRDIIPSSDLLKYQENSVQWMLKREKIPAIESLSRFSQWTVVEPPEGARHPKPLYYYPGFGLFSESSSLFSHFKTKGGILADESGLGKTVEVMALIALNKRKQFCELPMSKNKKKKNNDDDNEKTRECARCGEMFELKECGWQEEFDKEHSSFECVQCIAVEPPVKVKTTLIAVPEALIQNWIKEVIENGLKYKVYSGMDLDGYVNPLQIAGFDVILVSYEVLEKELSHTSKRKFVLDSKSKSYMKQKISLTSLTHVNWWRVVFDESQLINNPGCHVAQMCQLINAENRWCVTGTPIENDFSDLFGLFKLIQFWPFNIEPFWKTVVEGFNDLSKKNNDLSESLLILLASQIMRITKRSTVIDQMGIPKVVEIEQVVELSPIEDYRYKKAMEDVKGDVKKAMDTSPNNVLMRNAKSKGQIFDIIGNLKENLISGGEHDKEIRLKNIADDIHAEPKNCIIRQMSKKTREIKAALYFTIDTLLGVAEVKHLKNKINAAEGYADVANVFVMIEDLNKYTEQIKSLEIIDSSDDEDQEDDDRVQISNRKRGPTNNAGKPAKIGRFEDPEEREKLAVEKEVKREILQWMQNISDPISISEKFTIRFGMNILEVQKKLRNKTILDNAMDKMGGKDKLMANLRAVVERFSKHERNAFQIVREEEEKLTKSWDHMMYIPAEMSTALKNFSAGFKPNSKSLATKLMKLSEAKSTMTQMSFWPVFKYSHKQLEDGKLFSNFIHNLENCMGVCNDSNFDEISKGYQLSTNQQLLQHVLNYINRLETLRDEVMKSYTDLISFFQDKYLDTIAMIPKKCHTLLCEHKKCSNVMYTSDEERHQVTNGISCLICSAKISLAHLSFELGVGSYHGCERQVRGKLPIEKFLEMLLAVEQKMQPASEQFDNFVVYIEELRRTVGQIQAGFEKIEEYSGSLHQLYLTQKPMDINDLRRLDRHKHRTLKSFIKCYIEMYTNISSTEEKDLRDLCGDLRYLITLYEKEGSSDGNEENSCPICMETWTKSQGFVGFPCGHRVCQSCYPQFRNQQNAGDTRDYMKCASCRKEFQHADVIMAREKVPQNAEQRLVPGVNLTSKLRETIKLMREIIGSGSDENIVMFTSSKVGSLIWKYLVDVFNKAELPFCEVTGAQRGSPFQFSKECRILLCSHDSDQMGLDFTTANSIIFLDPSHSFLVNENAINRVVRFGQRRAVIVYHIGVESSLDDDIRKICKAGRGKDWTVGDIRKLFNIPFTEAPRRIPIRIALNLDGIGMNPELQARFLGHDFF